MLPTTSSFLTSELIKNLHAATFVSMLMRNNGLWYEAASDPFSICTHISLEYFETEKVFFLSMLRLSKKCTLLIKLSVIVILHNLL